MPYVRRGLSDADRSMVELAHDPRSLRWDTCPERWCFDLMRQLNVAPQTHCAHRAIHGSPLETTGMVEQGYFSACKVILR